MVCHGPQHVLWSLRPMQVCLSWICGLGRHRINVPHGNLDMSVLVLGSMPAPFPTFLPSVHGYVGTHVLTRFDGQGSAGSLVAGHAVLRTTENVPQQSDSAQQPYRASRSAGSVARCTCCKAMCGLHTVHSPSFVRKLWLTPLLQVKHASQFELAKVHNDGLHSYCRKCSRMLNRNYVQARPAPPPSAMPAQKFCSVCATVRVHGPLHTRMACLPSLMTMFRHSEPQARWLRQ